ncbi:MAG TPA: GNVR domain-containing protein [Ignavibacteria bacterium]|nr:GNVR domain-containing protein [Ignavibacteria bacterium]HQY52285.1 GNVR domain-containing protein [Ignavibacteria bacterium]HRA99090.1 GNVR domain-containing protein [Ignavibacteria bacterium]
MEEKEINTNNDIRFYIKLFLEKKKIIIINSFIGVIVSLILVLFVIDPIFYSAGIVRTSNQSSGLQSLMGLSGAGSLDFGDLAGFSGGGGATKELALYTQILTSRRAVEEAIIKYNIIEEEEFKYMFDAVKYFRKNIMEINQDKMAGTLEIGIYDKDPVKAKDIADFMIQQLNKIHSEMSSLNAKNNKEFLESRYESVKQDLKQVEDSLTFFQNNFGISPEITVQAAIKAEVELEAEIKSEELKLELLRKIISSGEPEILTQEDKISALKNQLNIVKETPADINSVLGLKGSPEVVMNFLRLRRNVEIQNKILTTIIPILEQSKIEEKKETPTVLILDPPNVPDKKAKPKRATIVLLITFLSGFLTYLFFLIKIKWKEFKGSYNF